MKTLVLGLVVFFLMVASSFAAQDRPERADRGAESSVDEEDALAENAPESEVNPWGVLPEGGKKKLSPEGAAALPMTAKDRAREERAKKTLESLRQIKARKEKEKLYKRAIELQIENQEEASENWRNKIEKAHRERERKINAERAERRRRDKKREENERRQKKSPSGLKPNLWGGL